LAQFNKKNHIACLRTFSVIVKPEIFLFEELKLAQATINKLHQNFTLAQISLISLSEP